MKHVTGHLLLLCTTLIAAMPAKDTNAADNSAEAVMSLDGNWQIIFDPANEGRWKAWHRQEVFSNHSGRREISVPSCWETIEKDYEGAAFYGRTFSVPQAWQGKTIRSCSI